MTSEPLFPMPASYHRTYVRVVELPWPLDGCGLEAVCRMCYWRSPALRVFYATAWEDALKHRQDVADEEELGWEHDIPESW